MIHSFSFFIFDMLFTSNSLENDSLGEGEICPAELSGRFWDTKEIVAYVLSIPRLPSFGACNPFSFLHVGEFCRSLLGTTSFVGFELFGSVGIDFLLLFADVWDETIDYGEAMILCSFPYSGGRGGEMVWSFGFRVHMWTGAWRYLAFLICIRARIWTFLLHIAQ